MFISFPSGRVCFHVHLQTKIMNSIGGMGWHNLPLTNKWTSPTKTSKKDQGSWLSHYPKLVLQHSIPRGSSTTRLDENVRSGLLPSAWAGKIPRCLGVSVRVRPQWNADVCGSRGMFHRLWSTLRGICYDLLIWFDTFPKFERTCSTDFHPFP